MPKPSKPKIIKKCTGCGVCISACPEKAIEFFTLDNVKRARIIDEKCTACRMCIDKCPFNAITTA